MSQDADRTPSSSFPPMPPPPPAPPAPASYWVPGAVERPLGELAIAVRILLGLVVLADLFRLLTLVNQATLLQSLESDPASVTIAAANDSDEQVGIAGFAYLPILLATSIVFIIWFYRARKNVDTYGPSRQRRSPGWAIGGWFCPVVNLWFPYQIAADVLAASHAPAVRGRGTLRAWWTLWLIANFLAVSAAGTGNGARSVRELITAADTAVLAVAVNIAAAILAVIVVGQITAAQRNRGHAIGSAGV